MKILVFLLMPFGYVFGQDLLSKEQFSHIDYMYGTKILQQNMLSKSLNDYDLIEVGRPISYIGVGITSEFTWGRTFEYMGHMDYAQIIPQRITIQDSVRAKIKGFNLSYTLIGMDFFRKSDAFDLVGTFGFNTGRFKLKGDDGFKYKNPFFAPMVSLAPRIIINNWSFQIKCTYEYDITNQHWKEQHSSDVSHADLPSLSSTGFNVFAGIGYRIWY